MRLRDAGRRRAGFHPKLRQLRKEGKWNSAARRGQCLSVTCEAILDEFVEKLQLKRNFDANKASEAADEVRAFSKVFTIPGALKVVTSDPDDDAVLECAVVGKAQCVLTGDRHLLALESYEGIRILTASHFLMLLQDMRELGSSR